MHDKLKEIYKAKLGEIKTIDVNSMGAREVPLTSFASKILEKNSLSLIAEIKKASPSKGIIRQDFNLENIIDDYKLIAADAISVLTDEKYFQGHIDYLKRVKQKSGLPILRKDFIISEKQIHQSYIIGADMILLIVGMLKLDELKHLLNVAENLGMDVLVETHTISEIDDALSVGAKIIGINNRDLNTFKVDINTALNLINQIPEDIITVAESGIHTVDDIHKIEQAGFNAVLIGEALMTSNNIRATYKQLFRK